MAEIYQTIIGVMSDIGAIEKNKSSQRQEYKYRGVDDVMNALQPVMVKYGLFVVPEIMEQRREERRSSKGNNLIYSVCTVRYTFYAKDGSSVQCVVIGEGMDSGDKATNKAMSVAFKYACFQVFCIPTDEMKEMPTNMDDPDAEVHEVAPKSKRTKKLILTPEEERIRIIKHAVVALCGGDKEAAAAYYNDNIKQDEGDADRMKWHLETIKKQVARIEASV